MSERMAQSHAVAPIAASDWVLKLADIIVALALIVLLLPMIALVAGASGKAMTGGSTLWRSLRRFRADQLPQLFGVLSGEYSFFRPGNRPRVFSD